MNWRTVCLLMLGGVVGCHAPPARIAGCDGPGPCRGMLLSRQVAADTVVTVAKHPVRSAALAVMQSADAVAAAGRGLVGKRLLMHLLCRPGPVDLCQAVSAGDDPETYLASSTDTPLQPADIQLYTTGADALAALLKMIDEATCRLDVIMFMWDQTPLGQTIAQHLAARAGPHLPVRILVDGGGNIIFGEPDTAPAAVVNQTVCWLSHQPYVQVIRIRNPCTRFDHRKLVIADGRIAWTGGRNFTDEGFFKRRDVSLTVTGPLAADMDQIFECFWEEQGGAPQAPLPAIPEMTGNAAARLVYTEPGAHVLEHTLYEAVDHACHHVYLENPYMTDGGLVYKLAQARHRGADVRVILCITTDTPGINHATRVTANRLLHAGVRVYLYPGWTHVKAAAVDGCWAYVGTGNFDPRSLRINHEIGLSISGGRIIDEIEQRVFQTDFRPEWELKTPLRITPADYYYELLGALCF